MSSKSEKSNGMKNRYDVTFGNRYKRKKKESEIKEEKNEKKSKIR